MDIQAAEIEMSDSEIKKPKSRKNKKGRNTSNKMRLIAK